MLKGVDKLPELIFFHHFLEFSIYLKNQNSRTIFSHFFQNSRAISVSTYDGDLAIATSTGELFLISNALSQSGIGADTQKEFIDDADNARFAVRLIQAVNLLPHLSDQHLI